MWNQGDAALAGEAKTTCELESTHKTLNSEITRYPHKTLWASMSMLKDEIGTSAAHSSSMGLNGCR
jgi:hypothetical protein